jgi:hypothetical protein
VGIGDFLSFLRCGLAKKLGVGEKKKKNPNPPPYPSELTNYMIRCSSWFGKTAECKSRRCLNAR